MIPFASAKPANLILVGDPNQLPATVISQELRHLRKDTSTMQRLISLGYAFDLLDTQYRMHPEIVLFPNRRFYQGSLQDAPTVCNRAPFNSLGLDWLQHYSFIHYQGEESRDFKSIKNQKEAVFVARLVAFMNYKGLLKSNKISVITFYAGQVAALRSALEAVRCGFVTVGTVDGFQGSEEDIVILSMVRSGSTVGFLKDFQRLNVSITRAKYLQLIVGDAGTLLASKCPMLVDLVADAKERSRHFLSDDILLVVQQLSYPNASKYRGNAVVNTSNISTGRTVAVYDKNSATRGQRDNSRKRKYDVDQSLPTLKQP